jgi:hypothetical protein
MRELIWGGLPRDCCTYGWPAVKVRVAASGKGDELDAFTISRLQWR